MKIVSAALLLCWLSLCRASPPTCEQLIKKVKPGQDVSGRWYGHAMSTDSCVRASVDFTLSKFSLVMNIKGTPENYEVASQIKAITDCNKPTTYNYGYAFYLLPGFADCIVVKEDSFLFGPSYMLLSPQPTIDVAALRQFEALATCFSSSYTQPLNNDYDFSNCRDKNADATVKEISIIAKRVEDFMPELGMCYAQFIWTRVKSYVQEQLGSD